MDMGISQFGYILRAVTLSFVSPEVYGDWFYIRGVLLESLSSLFVAAQPVSYMAYSILFQFLSFFFS